MRSALATLPTAYQVGFDLDHDEVYVSYDAAAGDAATVAPAMVALIQRVGFNPWLKGEGWPPDPPNLAVLPRR